jgi:hypothetical protein
MAISRIVAALLGLLAFGQVAHGETLAELVKKEEGVDFGPCALSPKPKLAGEAMHAVIPARFDKPGIWVTRTLLLVGVDAGKNVQGTLELKLADDVSPRESNVVCKKDHVTIRAFGKSFSYRWTGTALRRR